MQCNPNVRTIESELHSALVDTRAIHTCTPDSASNAFVQAPDAADGLRSIKWSRAARTDKGVSACGQVTSCWLSLVPNLTAKLNAALPSQIRVLGITYAPRRLCRPPPPPRGLPGAGAAQPPSRSVPDAMLPRRPRAHTP